MKKKTPLLMTFILLIFLALVAWYLVEQTSYSVFQGGNHPKEGYLTIDPTKNFYYELELPNQTLHFNLVDPEQAPEPIRDQVILGWKLMHQTQEYAKHYVGNTLYCGNCHFSCGNTFGGKNGSISLVGSTGWYPTYSERFKKNLTIQDRIQNCFKRSMNGKLLPEDSIEMNALVAYLSWISKDVEFLKNKTPWRGLVPLKSEHKPDVDNGKKVYLETCAPCHKADGNGMIKDHNLLHIPAVFGPNAFNDGAGMNRQDILSSFVYWNMPFQEPSLTEDQAIDVAAYVRSQPRPHFNED